VYRVERTASLSTPDWQPVDQQTADGFGRFQATDADPPAGAAFYRAVDVLNP